MARTTATKHYNEDTLPAGINPATFKAFEQADRLMNKYAAKRDALRDLLIAAFGKGSHEFGGIIVSRIDANVVDTKSLTEDYPAAQYPELYKTVLDTKAIPAEIKAKYTSTQERVSVK